MQTSSATSVYIKRRFARKYMQPVLRLSLLFNWTPTSPKAPKYSLIASSVASGFNPPTKIFLAGSFFIAIALLGSIWRPSSLCSFCSSTYRKKKYHQWHQESQLTDLRNVFCCFKEEQSNEAHFVHTGRVFKEHEAEASGPASVGVHFDGAVWNLPKLAEVILQVFFTRVPAEATNKHFSANQRCKTLPSLF